jgi:hypothetical protein
MSWNAASADSVAGLIRTWQEVQWSWSAPEVGRLAGALGWRVVCATEHRAELDTGLGVGGGYGSFLFDGGRILRLTVRLCDVVSEDDQEGRDFVRDTFAGAVRAVTQVLGPPTAYLPGEIPEVRWRFAPVTVRVEALRVAVNVVLAETAHVDRQNGSERFLAQRSDSEAPPPSPEPPGRAADLPLPLPPEPPRVAPTPPARAPREPVRAAAPPIEPPRPAPPPPDPPRVDPPPADPPPPAVTPPAGPAAPAPVPEASTSRRRPPPGVEPSVMQKVVPHHLVVYYLDDGYDRVAGYVYRWDDVRRLETPAQLFEALGLSYAGSSFTATDPSTHVIRWPAYGKGFYRTPYGGVDEAGMRAIEGWVIERPPFMGNGLAPGRDFAIPQWKVDSVRLPHGAEMWRIEASGEQVLVAAYDADTRCWQRALRQSR